MEYVQNSRRQVCSPRFFSSREGENEQNYKANMIMNVSGTVFQLIHYFPGKQRLAINLLWPALKSKQHMYIEFVNMIS